MNDKKIGIFDQKSRILKLGQKGGALIFCVFVLILLIGLSFLVIYPILTTLSLSLRPAEEMFDETVIWISKEPTFNNFINAIKELDYFFLGLKTIIAVVITSIFQLVSCSMAAYSISRFNYKFKNLLFMLVVFTIIVPPQTAQIPNFVSFRHFDFFGVGKLIGIFTGTELTANLLNTNWVLFIPAAFASGLQAGLYIFIFRQFFMGLPKGLEEAAKIDGCNALETFVQIVVPNCVPVFVVVFLLSVVTYWNDTTVTGIFLFRDESYLIMHKLESIVSNTMISSYEFGEAEVLFGAMAVIIIIPPILLYLICQTQFSEFLDRSGIKG